MRAYRAYNPPKAARSPSRAANTSEASRAGSGTGAVVTARQSLIVRRESTVVPAYGVPAPEIIPLGKTLGGERALTGCAERSLEVLGGGKRIFSSCCRVIISN